MFSSIWCGCPTGSISICWPPRGKNLNSTKKNIPQTKCAGTPASTPTTTEASGRVSGPPGGLAPRSAGQALFQQFGYDLVEPGLALLREGLDLLHQFAVDLDREGYQALRLIELALLTPARHVCGVLAEASRRGSPAHPVADLYAFEFFQFGLLHGCTSLFNRETVLYAEPGNRHAGPATPGILEAVSELPNRPDSLVYWSRVFLLEF